MTAAADRPRAQLERWPIRIRELTVLRRQQLTPRMVRLTLGGDNMAGFESHISDEHVKLVFVSSEEDLKRVPTQDGDKLHWPRPFLPMWDYSVRRYGRDDAEIDIDFALHDGGVASAWAQSAQLGSTVWVAGPPRGMRVPDAFTWRAYLGDETALPAIARTVSELPREVRGVVVVEVEDEAERQDLDVPEGMEVRWLYRHRQAAGTTGQLAQAARGIEIPHGGGAYVWYGGEQGAIKPLRAWVKAAGLSNGEFDLTGYWRRGKTGNQITAGDVLRAVKEVLHGHG